MRVYDLARELNVSNKELMAKLAAAGIAVKSPSSSINDDATQLIRGQFPKATAAAPAHPAVVPPPPADGPPKPPEKLAVKPAPEPTVEPVSKPSHPAGKPTSKHTSKPVEKSA